MSKNNLKVKRYINQADKYIKEAEKELSENNLLQASEKYWGGAAQMVKAWAESLEMRHNGHAWLFEGASKLSLQENDPLIKKQFLIASALHTNFYEGWLTKDEIETGALEIKAFCDKIKQIIGRER
ncbi:MAG: PaREP1 family protein [bacterium]